MNFGDIKLEIVSLALLVLVWLSGCASPDATQTVGDTQSQTAGTRQVIVVPIFIVSPPQDGGHEGNTLSEPGSTDQTGGRREPIPARM